MTKLDGKAPTILTAEGARRLTARLRDSMSLSDHLLVKAYEGRIWEALNYETWGAYMAKELPGYRMVKALDPEERAEVWAEQVRAGLSQSAVAEGAGVGKATVSRALKGKELPDTATGLDGKVRSTRSTVPSWNGRATTDTTPPLDLEPTVTLMAAVVEDMTNWQVVARHVARQGSRGLTSAEFEAETGWSHGKASAAFNAAEKKGYVTRLAATYRSAYGVYVEVLR